MIARGPDGIAPFGEIRQRVVQARCGRKGV